MAKKQKVKDDEIENVGIMQGFMDDIEELMEEITEAEMAGGDDQDMAKLMDRRPDSPEVLMNNLRGDYRSVDARREELADLVGMSAAVETPDDVLALLQPVLTQSGIESLTPSSSLPFGAMAPTAVAPPPMDAVGLPTPSVDPSGVGSLPIGMAEGGIVQNFQDGSGEAGVTPAMTFSPEVIQAAQSSIADVLAQQPAAVPDLAARTKALTPQYAEILGLGDRDAIKAQMLFDIGQAALGFAGNVGPQGQALRGSTAARLAQATSALPGQIGARAAQIRKEEQAATGTALQAAQAEQAAVIAANVKLAERQQDLLGEIAKQKTFRSLTETEKEERGLDATRPWQVDQDGKLYAPGGQPAANITVGSGESYAQAIGRSAAEDDITVATNAQNALTNIRKIDETLNQIANQDINTGVGATFFTTVDRIRGQFLQDPDAANRATQDQYLDSLLGSEVFSQIGALGIGARGLDTPAEREFLREVLTGTRSLNKDTLLRMTEQRRQREVNALQLYNDRVERGDMDSYFEATGREKRKFDVPALPEITMPDLPDGVGPSVNDPSGAFAELRKRGLSG